MFSYNYALSTNLLNEFRFGFTNYTENDTFPPQRSANRLRHGARRSGPGEKHYSLAVHHAADGYAFPTFNFLDGSITNIGQDRVGTTLSKTYEFTDNFTIIKHSHTMRFGFDTRRVLYNALMYFYASDDYGQFNFSGSLTNYSLGDFLLGAPQSNFADIGGPQVNAYAWHWGVYGQDEWQV